jgi:hypothetical protein
MPPLVLDTIFHNVMGLDLWDIRPTSEGSAHTNWSDIKKARLVCRAWNEWATRQLCKVIILDHGDGGGHEKDGPWFLHWNAMLDGRIARDQTQKSIIYSAPEDLYNSRDHPAWTEWRDNGTFPTFTRAIHRITELKQLTTLELRFSPNCRGEDSNPWDEDIETIDERKQTLQAVFEAIQHRANNGSDSRVVDTLTIENMQNVPIEEFTSSTLFHDVTKSLRHLNLRIAQEYNEHGPDFDIYAGERVTYEPFLHRHWLAPLSSQLTTLSLYFNECWGVMPGYFDGSGLDFPNLATLNLGKFTIGHHDQFEWVLRQSRLKCLRMDMCFILSFVVCATNTMLLWNVPTHDWKRLPQGAFGREQDEVYVYGGTWQTIFASIQERLTHLLDFSFCNHDDEVECHCHDDLATTRDATMYTMFMESTCPSPWNESPYSGLLPWDFNNDPDESSRDDMDEAREYQRADTDALQALLEAVQSRRA